MQQVAGEPKVLLTGLLGGFLVGYFLPQGKNSLSSTIVKNKGEEVAPEHKLQGLLTSPLALLAIDLLKK
jgi:hypothetical protein